MNDKTPLPPEGKRRCLSLAGWLSVLTCLLLAGSALGYYYYYPARIGVEQPIPFSHRFHVSIKHVSCLMCHEGATTTARAGIPPLETCMLCHRRIIIHDPRIEKLTKYFDERRPVEWVRVNALPNYVYFYHNVHLYRGFDCGKCHGDVAQMDRVQPQPEFTMGFCVQCHRDNQASHDCTICHR